MAGNGWSEEDIRIAYEMRGRGCNSIEIGGQLGRYPGAVRSKFGALDNPEKYRAMVRNTRQVRSQARIEKLKIARVRVSPFAAAMVRAIKSGQEKATVGVFKDDRPLIGAHFSRGLVGSGCGSSSLACAEF